MDKAKEILEAIIAAHIDLPWNTPSGIRADCIDEEQIGLMKMSGCKAVSFGIETGDQAMLSSMSKKLELTSVERSIRLMREAGIRITGFFILGLPRTSIADIRATVKYACDLNIDIAIFSRLLPVVGSKQFEENPEMQGLDAPDHYYQHTYLNNCYTPAGISERQLRTEFRRAYLRFYGRFRTVIRLLRFVKIKGLWAYVAWASRYMARILFRKSDELRVQVNPQKP